MEGTIRSSELDPDANHSHDKLTAGGVVSGLGVRAEEDTHNDTKLTKEEDVSGLGLLPEAKHDDDKPSREDKNKGSSSSSLSSSISGEHLGLIGREVDSFENSFNKSDPESPSSECASPLDVSAQTPQWSMKSASPRAGPGQSFSRELLPPNPDWSMSNSPMKSPLPQVMGRSAGYDPNRIPSSIFSARPTTPMEWSVASNESLFSIHMGNSSFSRDHIFMMGDGKLEEWPSSSSHVQNVSEGKSESNNFVTNLSPVLEAASETDKKSVDVRREEETPSVEPQRSQNIAAPNPEVRLSPNFSNLSDKKEANPTEVTPNSGARVSNESGTSSGSFAFPVLDNAHDGGKSGSLKAIAEKPEESHSAEPPRPPKAASASPAACCGWFSWFPSCPKCC